MSPFAFLTPESAPDGMVRFCVYCPNDDMSIWNLQGQLTEFENSAKWEDVFGNVSPADMVAWWQTANQLNIPLDDCCPSGGLTAMPVGSIFYWPLEDPPDHCLVCNGQYVSPDDYPELYALIGYDYGQSGDDFAVPNVERNAAVGAKPGTTGYEVGDTGGAHDIYLTEAQLPPHGHHQRVRSNGGGSASGAERRTDIQTSAVYTNANNKTGLTGDGDPIDIRNDYIALLAVIVAESE